MATKKFLITYMANIIFLLDSAALNSDCFSQKQTIIFEITYLKDKLRRIMTDGKQLLSITHGAFYLT